MARRDAGAATDGAGLVLLVLSSAVFIYVIDTTIMNVSISALVDDLGTTVAGVQAAITLYTLTMAAFMLTGGKLGDIWGSRRAFRIGLVVYGIGTTLTAVAPSLPVLILGWSVLEGLGSALIVPAINTLVRANYAGASRASAYGVLFGVAGAGAAFGPLIGGWITTVSTWRVAFACEAVVVVVVLLLSGRLAETPRIEPRPTLDLVGVVLSASGLGLFVLGVLQTGTRGWNDPVVVMLVVAGLLLLGAFWAWVRSRESHGRPTLIHPSIFRHRAMNTGLPILTTQTFAQASLLFLVPLFTQAVLGFDALQTGLTVLPFSVGILITSLLTPPLGRRIYPRTLIQVGLVLLFTGGVVFASSLDGATSGIDLALGLLLAGLAIGLIAGQLPNLILSGVESHEASEASGLQGTAQNLGMALGTAVVGTVILTVALGSLGNQVRDSDAIPGDVQAAVTQVLEVPLEEADADRLAEQLETLPDAQQAELARIYDTATLRGFQAGVIAGGIVALAGAALAFRLPKRKLQDEPTLESTVEEVVRSPTIPKMQLEMTDLPHDEGR